MRPLGFRVLSASSTMCIRLQVLATVSWWSFCSAFMTFRSPFFIRFIDVTLPCQHAAKEDTFNSVPAERHQKVLRQVYVPHSFQELQSILGFFLLTRLCVFCTPSQLRSMVSGHSDPAVSIPDPCVHPSIHSVNLGSQGNLSQLPWDKKRSTPQTGSPVCHRVNIQIFPEVSY